jgi:ribosomal protein S18 acetylase RimI-like enzyme
MLFASTELAARIERAETSLIVESVASARRRRPADDLFATPLAGAAACFAGAGSPLNKIVGLGFGGLPTPDELDAIERAYARRETPALAEVSTLADPDIFGLLSARAYRLVGFENVSGLALPGALAPRVDGVAIEAVGADGFEEWMATLVAGSMVADAQGVKPHEEFLYDTLDRALRDMAEAPGMLRLLARIGGEPAGAASMRICDGVAQLCGAATLIGFRRRGVQTALLGHRLAHAADMGCDLAVMTTLPGSKSQQNAQRWGFGLAYARAALVRQEVT